MNKETSRNHGVLAGLLVQNAPDLLEISFLVALDDCFQAQTQTPSCSRARMHYCIARNVRMHVDCGTIYCP